MHNVVVLQGLVPRLAAFPLNEQCGATAGQTVAELADLAAAIEGVGQTRPAGEQRKLNRGARVVSRLAVFLGKINKYVASVRDADLCTNRDVSSVLNFIDDTVADITIEGASSAERAKMVKQADYFKQLVKTFQQAELEFELEQPCGEYGSFDTLAANLEDVATIIEDVGVEALAKELNINLNI